MLAGCTPWPEELAAEYRARGYWEGITLPQVLERTIRAVPDKIALVDGERRFTYRELGHAIDRLAYGLVQLGLAPQDRAVFQLRNSAELVIAFFGLLKAGVIPVLALPAHRHAEIGQFLRCSGATAYLIPDEVGGFDYRRMAAELAPQAPRLRRVIVSGRAAPGQEELAALLDAPVDPDECARALAGRQTAPDDVALMLLSGGTTGVPKLIPRTHDDYAYAARASGEAAGFDAGMVFLAVLPMAHNYTLAAPGVLATFTVGGTVVVAPAATPEAIFPTIERERVTMVCATVPVYTAWLESSVPARHDLSSLRVMMNGGARLPPELRRRVEERFGVVYVESFGTGEGLLNQTRLDDPPDVRMNSSGRPVSPADELRIVDDDGNDVPDGERGELLCRGPYTVRGYFFAPEVNELSFTKDGFYRMGDVVRRVGGHLYVEGRKKDLVNRGGEKISCEEVESHIVEHPAVVSACVVSMPDARFGEKACAFVILRAGEELRLPQLADFLLARRIAKFKLPERLEVVDQFPLSPVGKVLRRQLRESIARKLEREQRAAAQV